MGRVLRLKSAGHTPEAYTPLALTVQGSIGVKMSDGSVIASASRLKKLAAASRQSPPAASSSGGPPPSSPARATPPRQPDSLSQHNTSGHRSELSDVRSVAGGGGGAATTEQREQKPKVRFASEAVVVREEVVVSLPASRGALPPFLDLVDLDV